MRITLHSVKRRKRASEDGLHFSAFAIHAPKLLLRSVAIYDGGKEPRAIDLLMRTYGLKREVVVALLTREVDCTFVGDTVVFDWPGDGSVTSEAEG